MSIFSCSLFLALTFFLCYASQPSNTNCFFREGQTFLTWTEDTGQSHEKYRIYRHTEAITASNLSDADLVAEINEGSSYFREMHKPDSSLVDNQDTDEYRNRIISRFVIQPVDSGKGIELDENTGLFIWTIKETSQNNFYYAITTIIGSVENREITDNNRCGPIAEKREPIGAVRYYVEGTGNERRDWYTMWMDYELFKESYMGYAFPFAIGVKSFSDGGASPLLQIGGIGTTPLGSNNNAHGAGDLSGNGNPSWYLGYHKSLDYTGDGAIGQTMQDTICNYIQYRLMHCVLWARRKYNATDKQFHVQGHSMGGSGSYGFGITYPSFVTSIFANEGVPDYANMGTGPSGGILYSSSIYGNYGSPEMHNPIKYLPLNDPDYPELDWITQFNGRDVFEMRDVAKFLKENTRISFGLISSGHGGADGAIKYSSHGAHFEEYIKNSRHCFSYHYDINASHVWGAVDASPMCQKMRWDESRPGFSNVPARDVYEYKDYNRYEEGSRYYLIDVEWGTKEHPWKGRKIEETDSTWSIPIHNYMLNNAPSDFNYEYFVNITPRNLQHFKIWHGDTFAYEIKDTSGVVEQAGTIIGDSLNLLLIPYVPIRPSGSIATVTLLNRGPNVKTDIKNLCAENFPEINVSPNPFNPFAVITFDIGYKSSARTEKFIGIYNIKGEKIWFQNIPDRIISSYKIIWDGKDVYGGKAASGVYIISAVLDNKKIEKRVLLSK